MSEPEKKNLIVKIKPSNNFFYPDLLKKTSSKLRTSRTLKITLFLLAILFVVCLTVALYFGLNDEKLRYTVFDRYDGVRRCGTMEFNDYDAITSYDADNVTTMSDGRAGITAVKINTTTYDFPSTLCLIRYDHEWGIYHPSSLPKFSDLDLLMTDSTENEDIPVKFDDTTWTIDVFSYVDYKTLPRSIQELCGDATLFKMIPKESGNPDDDEDEDFKQDSKTDSQKTPIPPSSQVENKMAKKKKSIFQRKRRQANKKIDDLNEAARKINKKLGDVRCCTSCMTTELRCSRICAPIQQIKYPYFFTTCKFVECDVFLPCVWWRSQAFK